MNATISDHDFLAKVIELYELVNTKEAVLLIDCKNIILFAGAKIQEIVGIPAKNLIGRNHFDVLPLPKENLEPIIGSLDKISRLKTACEFLSINLNHNKDYLILHCIEKPIINPSTQNIVAISVESKKIEFSNLLV